jgi:hypothetical protein
MAVYFASVGNSTAKISTPLSLPASQNLTFMCWLKIHTVSAAYRVAFGLMPNIAIATGSDGITFNTGTVATDWLGSALQYGKWHHLAVTVSSVAANNNYLKGYIDGRIDVDVQDTTSTFSTYTSIDMGNFYDVYPAIAAVQDCRLFNYAMNSHEIIREMRSSVPVQRAGLLHSVSLDDQKSRDTSGYNRVLTVTNATDVLDYRGFGVSRR